MSTGPAVLTTAITRSTSVRVFRLCSTVSRRCFVAGSTTSAKSLTLPDGAGSLSWADALTKTCATQTTASTADRINARGFFLETLFERLVIRTAISRERLKTVGHDNISLKTKGKRQKVAAMPFDVRKAFGLPGCESDLGSAQCWGGTPKIFTTLHGSAERFRPAGGIAEAPLE